MLSCYVLREIWYVVSLTLWSYTMLNVFTIDVMFYQVNLLLFCNVQTTNSTLVGKI